MIKVIEPKAKLLFLDGLRALAALYVLIHHAVLQYYHGYSEGLSGIKRLSLELFFYGRSAVGLFIVISGFCLMLPLLKNNYQLSGGVWFFFKRRIIRIIPPYCLAMVFSMVMIWLFVGSKTGTHWDVSIPFHTNDVLLHLFLVHDLFSARAAKINHSLWSISVECRIYLFFPFIAYCWRRINPGYILILSLISCGLIYACLSYLHDFDGAVNLEYPGINPFLMLFLFGMLAAQISLNSDPFAKKIQEWPVGFLAIVTLLAFIVISRLFVHYNIKSGQLLYELNDLVFGLFCGLLLIICVNQKKQAPAKLIQKFLSWPPLTYIGSFSYSIYLIHAPLIQLLTQYIIFPMGLSDYNATWALIVLSLLTIIPMSYLFFLVCEKPFMKYGAAFRKREVYERCLN